MHRRDFLLALSGGAIGMALSGCQRMKVNTVTAKNSQLRWQLASGLPVAMQEIYPALFQNHICIAGALQVDLSDKAVMGQLSPSAQTHLYNPIDDIWGDGPTLPVQRHHLGLVNCNQKLYGIGGFSGDKDDAWKIKADVFVLSDLNGQWQTSTPLPQAQAESAYASINNRIHVIGGRKRNNTTGKLENTDQHWVLDGKQWVSAAPFTLPLNSSAACTLNEDIYVVGGRLETGKNKNQTLLQRYDSKTDQWQRLASLPQASAGLACCSANGKIYAFGGEDYYYTSDNQLQARTFDSIWIYDPVVDQWQTSTVKMLSTRHGLGAITVGDNSIYLLGGAVQHWDNGTTDSVEVLTGL